MTHRVQLLDGAAGRLLAQAVIDAPTTRAHGSVGYVLTRPARGVRGGWVRWLRVVDDHGAEIAAGASDEPVLVRVGELV